MGGNVSWSFWPFSTDVMVGDNPSGAKNTGSPPILPGTTAKQVEKDTVDDGTPAGKARADTYVQEQIKAGVFNADAIKAGNESKPTAVDNRPPATTNTVKVDCTAIHGGYTMSTVLSGSITLNDFINKLVAIGDCKQRAVPAQCGLTPDQIVCNLAQLCKNVWIPIKQKYPNASITNSLRTGDKIGAGPHGTGQGMDIQFNTPKGSSVPTRDYFDIAVWVRDNVAYDQIILEYSTEHGYLVAWLHISIFGGPTTTAPGAEAPGYGKRTAIVNRVLTMMNHRVKTTGLANLGK